MRAIGVALAVLVAGTVHAAAPATGAGARVAGSGRDTVTTVVMLGGELELLLEAVAAATTRGLGEAERTRIAQDALALGVGEPFSRGRPSSSSYTLDVRFRGRDHRLAITLHRGIGSVEVRLATPDAALVDAIRAAVREAHVASLAPLGRARLHVAERRDGDGRRLAIVLAMQTERVFGCLGWSIETQFARRGDTLALHVDGIASPPGIVCPAALGPAHVERTLDVGPGEYVLTVDYRGDTSVFALAVTERALAVTPRRTTFVSLVPSLAPPLR